VEYELWSSSIYNYLQSPVLCSLLPLRSQYIPMHHIFKYFQRFSSLNVIYHVANSCKREANIF
jgi:hypothetical protein